MLEVIAVVMIVMITVVGTMAASVSGVGAGVIESAGVVVRAIVVEVQARRAVMYVAAVGGKALGEVVIVAVVGIVVAV